MSAVPAERPSPFVSVSFVRLWSVGGIANAVLWLEVLAASLYVLDVTGSGWAVALVSAARAAPLLVLGALAGVMSDAWNRKTIVICGLVLSGLASGTVSLLAWLGLVQPLYVAVAALVGGAVYATEMPARRRMVAESAGDAGIDAAVATDSLTGYATRCVGPVLGGVAYQYLGMAGAFLISALCSVVALCVIGSLDYEQPRRCLAMGHVPRDLVEAFRFAVQRPTILVLLGVTITMNSFGYSFSTLVAPIAKLAFSLDGTMTGVLAAAEPAGAFLGGLALTRFALPGPRLGWLIAGVAILTSGLLLTAGIGLLGGPLVLLCGILACAGTGSAVYTNNQTSIVMAETPVALRSRIMGLLTICIGSWPIGMMLAGALVERLPPLKALAVLAGLGLGSIACLAIVWNALESRPRS